MIWKVYGPGGKRQPDRRESVHKRKLVGRNESMGELFGVTFYGSAANSVVPVTQGAR